MKFFKKITFVFVLLMILGVVSVFAASKVIYSNSSFTVTSSGTTTSGLTGTYQYAYVNANASSMVGSSAPTQYKLYTKGAAGSYVLRGTKVITVYANTSDVMQRYIADAYSSNMTWKIVATATNGTSSNLGWTGTIKYYTSNVAG